LALEVYNEDNLRTERESWIAQATSAFGDIANANKNTLRHVELILPTGGIATPLNLLPLLIGIENLESLCVQWVRMLGPIDLNYLTDLRPSSPCAGISL
jgi:hypothetical protein